MTEKDLDMIDIFNQFQWNSAEYSTQTNMTGRNGGEKALECKNIKTFIDSIVAQVITLDNTDQNYLSSLSYERFDVATPEGYHRKEKIILDCYIYNIKMMR